MSKDPHLQIRAHSEELGIGLTIHLFQGTQFNSHQSHFCCLGLPLHGDHRLLLPVAPGASVMKRGSAGLCGSSPASFPALLRVHVPSVRHFLLILTLETYSSICLICPFSLLVLDVGPHPSDSDDTSFLKPCLLFSSFGRGALLHTQCGTES